MISLKKIAFVLCMLVGTTLLSYSQTVFQHDTRADSIDIKHYNINLDVTDFSTFVLKGNTDVIFKPLVNGINKIDLDLLGLGVDSIKDASGNSLTYTVQGLGFRVNLSSTYNIGDSTKITVYYHGNPVQDPTFGGFYYNATFAYNIGISLDDIPHNYGKTWFPCFDNFITRTTYDLYVRTLPAHNAACGGVYLGTVINGDLTETHHWRINQTIPSYLASAGVANYVFVVDSFTNYLNNYIPVWLAGRPTDTTNLKNSFINLEAAFDCFETKFGPYHWDRVGYQLVPMTSGAMEHAMNIAYPIVCANGSLTYQSIMAHELSHHWWGNLVTCRTVEDMWINEGSAAYCEHVFSESFSGRPVYDAEIRTDWKDLLRKCHIDDAGYWPLSGMPEAHTYGSTTYTKGALFLHTMRSYLGDSLFFNGLTQMLQDNKFSDMDAIEYRDDLSTITGFDLTNYFADWIFQGGWPHISIDSMDAVPSGLNYDVTMYLKQKLVGRTNYSTQVPLLLTLRDDSWNSFEQTIYSSGSSNQVVVTLPFNPTVGFLNRNERITHAVTSAYDTVYSTGTVVLQQGYMNMLVQTITDSAYVFVEHHWAAPDPVLDWTKGFTISPQRFWRVGGIWPTGFTTNAAISYNGKVSGTNSHLDHLLMTGTINEDSIVLLWRPDRATDWVEFPTYTKITGSLTDKSGNITITNLQKGEYAIALKGQTIGIQEFNSSKIKVYPNPSEGIINLESPTAFELIIITDMQGHLMTQKWVNGQTTQIDTMGWPKGTYILSGFNQSKRVFNKKVIVK